MHHRNDRLWGWRRRRQVDRVKKDAFWVGYGLALAALATLFSQPPAGVFLGLTLPLLWALRQRYRKGLEPVLLRFRGKSGTNAAIAITAAALLGLLTTILEAFGRLDQDDGTPASWFAITALGLACLAATRSPSAPAPPDEPRPADAALWGAIAFGVSIAILEIAFRNASLLEMGAAVASAFLVTGIAVGDPSNGQLRDRAVHNLERSGVALADPDLLEKAARVDTVIFHRSGVLTCGAPVVTEVRSLSDEHSPTDVARIAAIAEFGSRHPLRDGILRHGQQQMGTIPAVKGFESFPSLGVRAVLQGREVLCGNAGFLSRCGVPADEIERVEPQAIEFRARGDTVVWVATERSVIGLIALRDRLRPEAPRAYDRLRALGLSIGVMSGDASPSVAAQCRGLGPVQLFTGLEAAEAAAEIERLEYEGRRVAVVGTQDHATVTLKSATVPIELPLRGTTRESPPPGGGVLLKAEDLTLVPLLFEGARQWRRRVQLAAWGGTISQVSAWAGVACLSVLLPQAVVWFAAAVKISSEVYALYVADRTASSRPRTRFAPQADRRLELEPVAETASETAGR
ncbi:MAG TPA: HAD family hydrolase [Planctomycetota bacterium]|nr:HAD family hydrolase [Planctomycetota bacterium]